MASSNNSNRRNNNNNNNNRASSHQVIRRNRPDKISQQTISTRNHNLIDREAHHPRNPTHPCRLGKQTIPGTIGDDEAAAAAHQEHAGEQDGKPHSTNGELTTGNEMDGQQPVGTPFDSTEQMTKQEAQKMLQAIRDRDMLRRLRRQSQQRARRIPVDRELVTYS